MKTSLTFAALISVVCLARTADAQQRFAGVEYVAGRPDLARPFEATLVLDDRELRIEETVYSRQGRSVRTVFTIPLTDITAVGASLDGEADNPILMDRLRVSSPTDHHEYVTLTMMVGFGSLATSHYPGLQSMGYVAALGAGSTCIVSITILPALLTLLRRGRDRQA